MRFAVDESLSSDVASRPGPPVRLTSDVSLSSDDATRWGASPVMLGPMAAAGTSSASCVVTTPPPALRLDADLAARLLKLAVEARVLAAAALGLSAGAEAAGHAGAIVGCVGAALLASWAWPKRS